MVGTLNTSVRGTSRSGEEAFAIRSLRPGDTVLVDRPFARLRAPLPQLPCGQDPDLDAQDLNTCIRRVQELRAALRELCSTIVAYQPPDPPAYWNAVSCMTCPDTGMAHPVIIEIAAVCEFLVLQSGSTKSTIFAHWPDSTGLAVTRLVLTWMTNCLQYDGTSALFPHASKVNHSCDPNVRWDQAAGRFVAMRNIAAGETVTMAYLPFFCETTFSRCSLLYQQFFFWCQCPVCERSRRWTDVASQDVDLTRARHAELRIAQALLRGDGDGSRKDKLLLIADGAGMHPDHFVVAELLGTDTAASCDAVQLRSDSGLCHTGSLLERDLPENVNLDALD